MNKRKLLIWFLFGVVMMGAFRLAQSRSLSFHFVDEEDHIVTASYMNRGYKLYKDLSVNHQPLVYLGSSWLQKILKPPNIFLLIRRHRLAMFGYAALWSSLLVWKFGITGLLFVGMFEGVKFYLFGNLWLMESMAVYPTVYMLAVWFKGVLTRSWPKKWESVFLGFCSFLIIFNLVPLWPWLGLIWLLFLINNKKFFLWQLGGLMLPTFILFLIISPVDWFRETVYYNLRYAMPKLSVINTAGDWLKIIFFPFQALIVKGSYQAQVIQLLITGWVVGLGVKKRYGLLLLSYCVLMLANLRVLSPTSVFYDGFHLLPWMGVLLMTFLLSIKEVKSLIGLLVFGIWGVGLLVNRNLPIFWKTDVMNEYYINYSHFDDISFAVKLMAKPGDRLAVLSSESLIYWNTGTELATKQVVYYPWEHDVPLLQKIYGQVFKGENPPEFIYGSNEAGLVKAKYTPLFRNSKPTELYVKNSVIEFLPETAEESLNSRNFSIL